MKKSIRAGAKSGALRRNSRSRLIGATVALGTAALIAVPMPAMAQGVVSQSNGRLVQASLLDSSILDTLVTLKGANAVNTDASGDVIVDTPLDASAVAGLIALKAGPLNLPVFGSTGIIRLGAVGQYARANDDGSSDAFSGTVTDAPSLIGVNTVTAGPDVGSPTAGSSAELSVGTAALLGGPDLVNLDVNIGALAASAHETAADSQSGEYDIANLGITVGGTLVAVPTSALRPVIGALITILNANGINTINNPFSAGDTITLMLADLQAAGLGSDLTNLPPDTDLLSYVSQALINKITALTNGVLLDASTAAVGLPIPVKTVVTNSITATHAIADPLLGNLGAALEGPVGTAIGALAQLDVNHQSSANGTFTETALHVGLGTNGALATADLASATVGPNTPVVVPPTTTPTPPTTTPTTPTTAPVGKPGSVLPRVDG